MAISELVSDRRADHGCRARLSIIVSCLNEEAVIVKGLTALAPLRRRGAELILGDGGSSDRRQRSPALGSIAC